MAKRFSAAPEPEVRHDAPSPEREYVAFSPLYWIAWCVAAACVAAAIFWANPFVVASGVFGFAAMIVISPEMIDNRWIESLDRWGFERAKRRQTGQLRRLDRSGAIVDRLLGVLPFVFLAGGLLAVVVACLAQLDVSLPTGVQVAALVLLIAPFGLAPLLALLRAVIAGLKGDIALGPVVIYKTKPAADWLRTLDRRGEVILVLGALASLFVVIGAAR